MPSHLALSEEPLTLLPLLFCCQDNPEPLNKREVDLAVPGPTPPFPLGASVYSEFACACPFSFNKVFHSSMM